MDSTLESTGYSKQSFMPPQEEVRKKGSPGLQELGNHVEPENTFLDGDSYVRLFGIIATGLSESDVEQYMDSDPLGTGDRPEEDIEAVLGRTLDEPLYDASGDLSRDELHDYARIEKALTEIYQQP